MWCGCGCGGGVCMCGSVYVCGDHVDDDVPSNVRIWHLSYDCLPLLGEYVRRVRTARNFYGAFSYDGLGCPPS